MAHTQPILERPLPHNLDAERAVLGAILLDNYALNRALEKLSLQDFFFDPRSVPGWLKEGCRGQLRRAVRIPAEAVERFIVDNTIPAREAPNGR